MQDDLTHHDYKVKAYIKICEVLNIMEKLYIVIPAYNEEENILEIIEEWYPIVKKISKSSRLVIVNDGSEDSTYDIMQECTKDKSQLIPLTKENSGHGATILYAYHYALNHGADYIFQTDSDRQTLPSDFWLFWNKRKNYDIIIGHRTRRQDGVSRILITKVLKMIIRIHFGVTVVDANTPFRLMESNVLKQNINLIPDDFNLSNIILSVIYEKKGLRVKYIPITFRPRQGGVNSINMKKIFRIGIQAVRDFRKIADTLKM